MGSSHDGRFFRHADRAIRLFDGRIVEDEASVSLPAKVVVWARRTVEAFVS